ncbi:MAG TPA: hypothetical protein V6D15_20635 [Oculatellaceae cyanobacterium]|jgi:hypothetical protein
MEAEIRDRMLSLIFALNYNFFIPDYADINQDAIVVNRFQSLR